MSEKNTWNFKDLQNDYHAQRKFSPSLEKYLEEIFRLLHKYEVSVSLGDEFKFRVWITKQEKL